MVSSRNGLVTLTMRTILRGLRGILYLSPLRTKLYVSWPRFPFAPSPASLPFVPSVNIAAR